MSAEGPLPVINQLLFSYSVDPFGAGMVLHTYDDGIHALWKVARHGRFLRLVSKSMGEGKERDESGSLGFVSS